ncbi:MAG: hypothetical protein JST79_21500 [Acidobacteria bacterium]|jgi:hypothetical protein|nr:hypothetical protein [Acidobacteriota bacterium]
MSAKNGEAPVPPKSALLRKLLTAVLVVAAFFGAYSLGKLKRKSRLDNFAKCLAAKPVKMYGAYWCPHCAEQKELFGSSFKFIPYTECGVPGSREESPACKLAGIKNFPTWEFPSGERKEGKLSFQVLSEKSTCPLP